MTSKKSAGAKIFQKYNDQILKFANTQTGKFFLGFDSESKIIKLTPESIHLLGKEKGTIISFHYTKEFFVEKLYTVLASLELSKQYGFNRYDSNILFSHFLGIERKSFLPTIYFASATPSPSSDAFIDASNGTWSTARNAASGTLSSNPATAYIMSRLLGGVYYVDRYFANIDTSSLGVGSTVTAGTWTVTASGSGDASDSSTFNVYNSNHADTIVSTDFSSGGSTAWCNTSIAIASWGGSGSKNFTLNSSGIAGINVSGTTKLCMREATYDVGNSTPSVTGNNFASFSGKSGTNPPVLSLTYTPAPATANFLLFMQ